MKFCYKCKKSFVDNAIFCDRCGGRLAVKQTARQLKGGYKAEPNLGGIKWWQIMLVVITVILLVLTLIAAFSPDDNLSETVPNESITELDPKLGVVMVNGERIEDDRITVYKPDVSDKYDYAHMPFLKVLSSLDVDISGIDQNGGEIVYGDNKYVLDLKEKTFVEKQSGFNWFLSPPGNGHYYNNVINDDIVLDDNTVSIVLYEMGIRVYVHADYENATVYINDRED